MLTLEQARKAVRLKSKEFDDELGDLIHAAIADLKAVGVQEMNDDDLYDNALRMYVKGYFEIEAPGAETCRNIYEDIKLTMKLTDRYREESQNA